jgi:acetyl coenzyme A synthetase (ADP forming)-like protein
MSTDGPHPDTEDLAPADLGYPAHWASDAVLTDGGTVHLRPITPGDADALRQFHQSLSLETTYFRFFSPHPELSDDEVTQFTHVDYDRRVAIVAELGGDIVAVGRYEGLDDSRTAEVAFVVTDAHQGRGLGTLLLEQLAAAARERGINRFVAETLPNNRRMIQVFRDAGFEVLQRWEEGAVSVELAIEPTERSRAAVEAREHRAAARSIARLLEARAVAVIGASRRQPSVGHQVMTNLLDSFEGVVFPVNPAATSVAGVKAYPTITDVPDPVELAVVAVPTSAVLGVVTECAAAGVESVVVLSAGFGEIGREGAEVEAALRDLARANGMRMVGPNCVGVANTATGLNATFSTWAPERGSVAMQTQSGALGIALLERSRRVGIGVSSFVSVGNKADVSGNDLLEYWEDDATTKVILLYLESFGNPRRFSRIARRVSRRKPIVAVKSGRTEAGARAASSHTAAMASVDVAVDALFRQTGVVRVDTVDELFDTARVFDWQPLPSGQRVAIVGNSGGPGVLAADALVAAGLSLAPLATDTRAAIAAVADANASVLNPVDLVASATPETFEAALAAALSDDAVDAVLAVATPTYAAPADDVAETIGRASSGSGKPVVACFLAWPDMPPLLPGGVPAFAAPEPAVRALGRAAQYAEWRRRDPGTVPDLDVDVDAAQSIVDGVLAEEPAGRWLGPDEVDRLLGAYRIPRVPYRILRPSPDDAVAAADELGYPVVVKASGPKILHKSDIGGVKLHLATADEVRDAVDDVRATLGRDLDCVVVQPQVSAGVELIVGVTHDRTFGPLVMVGLGGVAVELLGDRQFRVLPVTDVDAAELIRSLRGSALLFGYRSQPAADVAAIEDVILRVARLAADLHEIAEVDLNPVLARPDGATVLDARVRVVPPPRPTSLDARHMSRT